MLHTYQIKRAYALNPATGRATRTQTGWTLLRDGVLVGTYRTRQAARDARAAGMAADAAAVAVLEKAQRRARLQAMATAVLALVAAVVLVLGLLPAPAPAVAATARHAAPAAAVQVVDALALPTDAAFAALFVPDAR